MKKLFLGISLICLLLVFFTPFFANAAGLVPCEGKVTCTGTAPNQTCTSDCNWTSLQTMIQNILNFVIWKIAIPLSVLALTIGGIILLTSAGNPQMSGLGKKILWAAVIGLFLALCSTLIINFVLKAIGSSQTVTDWNSGAD